MSAKNINHRLFLFLSLAGVVYASLVPFGLRPIPFEEAVARFSSIPYLRLGAQSRADWIANILLYLPLGVALSALVDNRNAPIFQRGVLMIFMWGGCACIAVGIEFLQVFFPPRTVSLNDIIAEGFGALIGISLWEAFGPWVIQLVGEIRKGGGRAVHAVMVFYTLGFLLYSLFPFDIILSFNELAWKASHGGWGFFLTEAGGKNLLRSGLSLLLEMVSVIPFGVFFIRSRLNKKPGIFFLFLCGFTVGVAFECAQLFLISGTSQGVSVVAKTAGFVAGGYFPDIIQGRWVRLVKVVSPKLVLIAGVPYALGVAYLNGWLTHPWIGIDAGLDKLNRAMAIPFYFHYFSTETNALLSVMLHAALYGLIGIGVFVIKSGEKYYSNGRSAAMVLAAAASLIVESGKLFLRGKSPDFTNVLIAGGSAWLAYGVFNFIRRLPWFLDDPSAKGAPHHWHSA